MTPRFQKNAWIVFSAVLSPLSLLTVLVAASAINPMGLAFLTEFTIVNETPSDIWVTPLGAVGREGRRATLPYSRFSRLCVMSAEDRDFHIPPKSSRTFVYDCDDIQFSEILVRSNEGPFRIMHSGLHPTEGQYRMPQQERFVFSDLDGLEEAGPVHLKALESEGRQRVNVLHGLAVVGLLPPVILFHAFKRQGSKTVDRNAAPCA
jgi:hypothetical protein